MKKGYRIQTMVLLAFFSGVVVVWGTTLRHTQDSRAQVEIDNLWTEKLVKEGMTVAGKAMLQIAVDPEQDRYRRKHAVKKLSGLAGVGAREQIQKIADSIPEERTGDAGWRYLKYEALETYAILSFYEAQTTGEQYNALTNMAGGSVKGRGGRRWSIDRLITRADDRDWPLIEKAAKIMNDPDGDKLARVKYDLAKLAKQDPAAFTNTLQIIAGEHLFPRPMMWKTKEAHDAFMEKRNQAMQRAHPYRQKAGQSAETLGWWAYYQLFPTEERQQLFTLKSLLEKGVLTTNQLRQCQVPEIKNTVDNYIIGTNRPPWEVLTLDE